MLITRGGTPKLRPFAIYLRFIVPTLLRPVRRSFPRLGAGSNADCALRKRVCLPDKFPKVRRRRDGLTSRQRQPRPHTRPFVGARDGSALPARRDVWRSAIGSQLLLCGNPLGKFPVAVLRMFPASRR